MDNWKTVKYHKDLSIQVSLEGQGYRIDHPYFMFERFNTVQDAVEAIDKRDK